MFVKSIPGGDLVALKNILIINFRNSIYKIMKFDPNKLLQEFFKKS